MVIAGSPTNGDTITLNGAVFTFVASGATQSNYQIDNTGPLEFMLGFFLSRNVEPLKAPEVKKIPAKVVVKEVTLPAESKPAVENKDKEPEPGL